MKNKDWTESLFKWGDDNIPDLYFVEGDDDFTDEDGTPYFEGFWTGLPRDKDTLLSLEALDLSWHGVSEIPEQLRHLTQLKSLTFDKSRDGLTAPHWKLSKNESRIKEIPDWISELHNLEELSLVGNNIRVVPEAITKLTKLRKLYLSRNHIMSFHRDMDRLIALEVLWLDGNYLQQIPDFVYQLRRLQQLNLCDNQIDFVASDISNLTELECLEISHNHLSDLPDFSRLTKLNCLGLDGNKLTIM